MRLTHFKILYVVVYLLSASFVYALLLSALSSQAYALTPVSSCQILTPAHEIFELTQDIVVTNDSCLSINSVNVTLNGNGYRIILRDVDQAIVSAISTGFTATNATIYNISIDTDENATGILITDTQFVRLENITFNGSGSTDRAIAATTAQHITIDNVSLTSYPSSAIALFSATYVNVSNVLLNQSQVPLNVTTSTQIVVQNVSYVSSDIASQNRIIVNGSSHVQFQNISREQTNLQIHVSGSSSFLNLTNVSLSLFDVSGQPATIRITNSVFTQSNIVAINLTNVSTFYAENISVQNATQALIDIHADPLVNATLTGYTFTNISTTNSSVLLFNQTSNASNVSISFFKTVTPLFEAYGDLRVITFEESFGVINLSQPINGSGNFSQLFAIANMSIVINDTFLTRANQSLNVSYFQLITNNTNQRILRNGVLCFDPQCVNLTQPNQTVASYTFDRAANFTLIDLGLSPPHVATSIVAAIIDTNNITWTWVNPTDVDFNGSMLYVNGTNVANVSRSITSYNLSTLSDATTYEFNIRTIDYDGYINTTFAGVNATTLTDTVAPNIVGLLNASSISRDTIFYNWTLPTQVDYAHIRVVFEGVLLYNATNITNLTLTGLAPNTTYNLTITSVDINENTNATSNISITTDDFIATTQISACGTIIASGSYVFSGAIIESNYTCLYIRASDVNIDLNGTTILYGLANTTTNASGIFTSGYGNITLYNGTVQSLAGASAENRFNLTQIAIFTNDTTTITLDSLNLSQSETGAQFRATQTVTLRNLAITNTNRSLVYNGSATQTTLTNISVTNTSFGFIFANTTLATVTNVTITNATALALNVSSGSHVHIYELNISLPTNRTSAWLLDAMNTTTIMNSSITYDTILITNFSMGNASGYIVALYDGNISITKRNFSAITFRLNETPIDSFNITESIYLGYNSVQVNTTTYPYLNVSAQITFYDMAEGAPVYMLRDGAVFNSTTNPSGYGLTQLYDYGSPIINTTSLDGNYSLRGYTLKLLNPANNSIVTSDEVNFRYYVTPTIGRELTGCNLSLNGTNIDQKSAAVLDNDVEFADNYEGLEDGMSYYWEVYCLDNLSVAIRYSANFTVDIPTSSSSSSSSRSSGAFGAYPGAAYPWVATFKRDAAELNQSFSISLRTLEGVRIKVNNNSHHVGIISVTSSGATINVSSKPQQATLKVGESKQFVVDENQTTGIVVTLDAVATNRANITVAPYYIVLPSTSAAGTTGANATNTTANSSDTTGGNTSPYAQDAKMPTTVAKFVATKGIVVLVVIAGMVLFCGLIYYFYLILRYKKGIAQPLNQLSAKKGFLAEFIFPFLPGGEFWKKKEDLVQAINNRGPKKEDIERYAQTVVPLVPATHADHIESRLRAGNTFAYIEFELIQNGYTREQAKALLQQYQIDQYVRNCIYAGATNEQVKTALQNAGWSAAWIAKTFPIKDADATTQSLSSTPSIVPQQTGIFGNQRVSK